MKHNDLRDKLKRIKYAVTQETTIYLNGRYIGFRHSDLGIAFLRLTKKGIKTHKNGRPRWYHSLEGGILDAARYVRKIYGLKVPVNDWEVIRIKHYNTSTAEEILQVLNLI